MSFSNNTIHFFNYKTNGSALAKQRTFFFFLNFDICNPKQNIESGKNKYRPIVESHLLNMNVCYDRKSIKLQTLKLSFLTNKGFPKRDIDKAAIQQVKNNRTVDLTLQSVQFSCLLQKVKCW